MMNFQGIEGKWFTYYFKGLGNKLASFRDCISLNIKYRKNYLSDPNLPGNLTI